MLINEQTVEIPVLILSNMNEIYDDFKHFNFMCVGKFCISFQ